MNSVVSKDKDKIAFYGLLIYIGLFYLQPAGRFPILAPFRIEFIVGIWMILIAIQRILTGRVDLRKNNFNYAAIFFFLYLLLAIPFALVKLNALEGTIAVFKLFSIYLMIVVSINNEKKLKIFLFVYLCLISILYLEPLLKSNFVYNNHMMRLGGITGYFAHPNQLGMITAAHIPFFYYLLFYIKSKTIKTACIILILTAIRVVMLTESRTAMLGVLAFGIFAWLYSTKKKRMLMASIISLIIIWSFMPQESRDRFLTLEKTNTVIESGRSTFDDEENRKYGSMVRRWVMMKQAVVVFIENPIIGVGLSCYTSYSGRKWNSWFPPHNTYLQALGEIGVVGFSCLLLIIYFTMKNLHQAKECLDKKEKENTFLYAVIKPIKVYYLVYLCVSFFGIEIFSNFWWLCGGLSVVILRLSKQESKENIVNSKEYNSNDYKEAIPGLQEKLPI